MKKQNKLSLFAKVAALSLGVVLSTTACGPTSSNADSKENLSSKEVISSETNSSEAIVSKSSEPAPTSSSKSSEPAPVSSSKSSEPAPVSSSSSTSTATSSFQEPVKETGTTLTVGLGVAQTFTNNVATVKGVGTVGSDYTPTFKLTKVSTDADAMTVTNNKTRFKEGDTIENVDKLGGVTNITIHGGNGNYRLFVGYSQDKMYEFLEAESQSGDRIFDKIPNINYFKLVGKYNSHPADIADITITYSRNSIHELVYGEPKAISECTKFDGTFVKGTNTIVVAGDKVTLNGTEYTFTGIVYDSSLLYVNANNEGILVKFDNENTAIVINCVDKYSSLSGTYSKVIPATEVKMFKDEVEVAANTADSRFEMEVGQYFNFSATCNAVPTEDVAITLTDETNGGEADPYVGTYTPRSTVTIFDASYVWNDGESFELTVNPIVVTKENGAYKVTYSDVATSDYTGTSGKFNATVVDGKLKFTTGYLTIKLGSDNNHTFEFDYYDDEVEFVCASGSVACNFASSALPTATYADGKVTAKSAGNFYLTCTTSNNVSAKYYVRVKAYVPATVSVNPASISLEKNATYQINATVNADATNKTLSYSSDKTNIATVSASGLVTAKAKGTAVITIKTADNNTATLTVNVTEPISAVNYTFMDDDGVDHTLTVTPNVGAVLDGTYNFAYSNNVYVYESDPDCTFTIRNAGGTTYLDFTDVNMTIFGYAGGPVTIYGGDSIEIYQA